MLSIASSIQIPKKSPSLIHRLQYRCVVQVTGSTEARIAELGLQLPSPAVPKGCFVNFVRIDNLAYLSGHLPQPADGALIVGKVGEELTVEQGYEASKYVGLNLLATLKHNLGDLDQVKRVVKLFGLVNCVNGFGQQPAVINGCSDLMVKVFGENGNHVRSAVGTNSLPFGVAVEIEAIFELHPIPETETETKIAEENTPDSK